MIPFHPINPSLCRSFVDSFDLSIRHAQMQRILRRRVFEESLKLSPCEQMIYQLVEFGINGIEFKPNLSKDTKERAISYIWDGILPILELSFPMMENVPEKDPGHQVGLKYQSLSDEGKIEAQIEMVTEFKSTSLAADKIGHLIATMSILCSMNVHLLSPNFFPDEGYLLFESLIDKMVEATFLDSNYTQRPIAMLQKEKPLEYWLSSVERRVADVIAEELKIPLIHENLEYFPVFGFETSEDLRLMILYLSSLERAKGNSGICEKISSRCERFLRPLRTG